MPVLLCCKHILADKTSLTVQVCLKNLEKIESDKQGDYVISVKYSVTVKADDGVWHKFVLSGARSGRSSPYTSKEPANYGSRALSHDMSGRYKFFLEGLQLIDKFVQHFFSFVFALYFFSYLLYSCLHVRVD